MNDSADLGTEDDIIQIEKMSADQFAGAVVLILGAIGSLLLVVWQSKCHCKVNLCYICQCERRPPNQEELKTLADEAKSMKDKQKKINKKEDVILDKEEQILDRQKSFDFDAELKKIMPPELQKQEQLVPQVSSTSADDLKKIDLEDQLKEVKIDK
jgi:hypothetical protein